MYNINGMSTTINAHTFNYTSFLEYTVDPRDITEFNEAASASNYWIFSPSIQRQLSAQY